MHAKRPLSVHDAQGAILPAPRAQQLSPQINVELVAGQEVCGQMAYEARTQAGLYRLSRYIGENMAHVRYFHVFTGKAYSSSLLSFAKGEVIGVPVVCEQ